MTDHPDEVLDLSTSGQTPTANQRRRRTVAGVAALGLAAGGAVLVGVTTGSAGGAAGASAPSGSSSAAPSGAPGNRDHGRRGFLGGKYDIDGLVTKASSSSITVRSLFGTSLTYTVNSKTQVRSGPQTKLDVDDIDTGARVHVHGDKSDSLYVAEDIDLRHPNLVGSITDVSGDDVTITDNDGFTRHITVSSATKYTKDGKSASKSVLTDGAAVRAEGTVDSDKTTLDATRVDVWTKAPSLPAGPGGHFGGPGGRGPGGHGMGPGNGSRPQPPSGAPSGAPSGQPSNGSGTSS